MATDYPLVTLAFPLYRSARFLSVIRDNIAAFTYPNLEIIISDRHGFDDALAQLQAQYANDSRFRFIRATDQIDWVSHYNELLRLATGTYFCWMPHDDSYPAEYISQLVDYLENNPDRIVAFGQLNGISYDGAQPVPAFCNQPVPTLTGHYYPLREALWMVMFWTIGIPFRGLFRREPLLRANLWIHPTKDNVAPDVYWMFGVALLGRFGPVPECSCLKRFYRESTHVQWKDGARQRLEAFRVLYGYLKRSGLNPIKVIGGTVVLASWTLLRLIAYLGGTSPVFKTVKSTLKRVIFGRMLKASNYQR
ncbi:glycosyltransferase family 2 protein [Larkinella sp. VNQ87]|uniref:glycosyltransferase family 2 protein n=1 Tax=Larkinella sp. VNQ87 TaxID=3400921 RepID=UPI003C083B06